MHLELDTWMRFILFFLTGCLLSLLHAHGQTDMAIPLLDGARHCCRHVTNDFVTARARRSAKDIGEDEFQIPNKKQD